MKDDKDNKIVTKSKKRTYLIVLICAIILTCVIGYFTYNSIREYISDKQKYENASNALRSEIEDVNAIDNIIEGVDGAYEKYIASLFRKFGLGFEDETRFDK